MCVVWDMCTIDLTNNTTSPMTLSTASTSAGTWDTSPPATIAPNSTSSFAGRSTCGNASSGCAGTVAYSLTDGTLVNIEYVTSYYYGIANDSAYTPGFQGPRANMYQNKTNNPVTVGSNGGAGKRVTWTLSIDPK
jgi:hypothetical protein